MRKDLRHHLVFTLLVVALARVDAKPMDELGPVVWGDPTNGVRAGLQQYATDFGSRCILYTSYCSTNLPKLRYPDIHEMFTAIVRDADGKRLEMTVEGQRYGRPLSKNVNILSRTRGWVAMKEKSQAVTFNVERLFKIPKAGECELEVQLRLFEERGGAYLEAFVLPAVKAKVKLGAGKDAGRE